MSTLFTGLLYFGIILHLGFGIWMYGNDLILAEVLLLITLKLNYLY